MVYLKYSNHLLFEYILFVAGVMFIIVGLIAAVVFMLKAFVKQNAERGEFKILFFNNKSSIVDFLGAVIFAVTLVVLIPSWTPDVLADIPYAIKRDFTVSIGVVVEGDDAGDGVSEQRSFILRDFKTGEEIDLLVFAEPIREGEICEVMYLPHTRLSVLIRKKAGDALQ